MNQLILAIRNSALSLLALSVCVFIAGSCSSKKQKGNKSLSQSGDSSINVDVLKQLDDYMTPITQEEAGPSTARTVDLGDEDEDLDIVLPQCGIPDFADADAKTFSTLMEETYTRVINAGFATALVDITSKLDLNGTLKETTLDVHVSYANAKGTSELGAPTDVGSINQRAADLTRRFAGYVTNYTVANNSNFSKEWTGIVCTVRAADHLKNTRDGYTSEVSFYPPIAPAVSPIADAARYGKELGEFRFFRNITATVTASDNPALDLKKKYIGSILIEKIPAERMTPIGLFKGDVAYRVSNRFGSNDETLALDFHLWTEYYIDHGQRAFSGIITDVGDDELRYFAGIYKGESGVPKVLVSYAKDIAPLIKENCSNCHRPNNAPRLDLSTYEQVKKAATEKGLIGRVLGGSMPPTGALSGDPKKLFSSWSQTGFPQ